MLKRILFLGFLITAIGVTNINAQFAGGAGTEEDPYQISTVEQLQEIRNHLDKHFIQINDIDASETVAWHDSAGFVPIGDRTLKFRGSYFGNEFSIKDLNINRPYVGSTGLFGVANGATIRNVKLVNVSILGLYRVGGLIGRATNCQIEEAFISGNIEGNSTVGGLIGWQRDGYVKDSKSHSTVIGITNDIGGLIGRNEVGVVRNSFSIGVVTGGNSVGGLIGVISVNGSVINSYSHTNVNGDKDVGGLVGTNNFLYNEPSQIIKSFATGEVTGNDDLGGLIGVNAGQTLDIYWNTESTSQANAVGRGSFDGTTGLSTEQMKSDSAFYYMSALDFENTWLLTEGYPALYWEDVESITPPEVDPPSAVNLLNPENHVENIAIDTVLKWSSVGANSYELQVSADSLFSSLNISEAEISDTTFTLSGELNFGTNYYWRVQAKNLVGAGAWSDTSVFTTEYALSTPVLDTPLDSTENITVPAQFVWFPVNGANDYELQISPDESFDSLLVLNSPTSKNKSFKAYNAWKITQEVDDLDYGTQYFWRVRAENEEGPSEWSKSKVFTTDSGVPDVPVWSPENGEENVPTSPKLTWDESRRAQTYQVQLSLFESFSDTLLNIKNLTQTEYEVNDLEGSTTYYWRVQAHNDLGASGWSDVLNFTTELTTSLDEQGDLPKEVTLHQNYPNPFNPTTQIRYGIPEAGEVSLKVFNMLGQEVITLVNGKQSAGWHTATFDASGLSSGFYIYRIQAGNFVSTKKLMLIK